MKAFIDTNVFVYAYDRADRRKQRVARTLLARIEKAGSGVVSLQVQQEFFWVATRKLEIDPAAAKAILQRWLKFELVLPSPELLYDAIDCSIAAGISFWDSLVVVSAERARCDLLYSEDMNHEQVIRGVKVVNPFV